MHLELTLINFAHCHLQHMKTHILHNIQWQDIPQLKYILFEKPPPGGLLNTLQLTGFPDMQKAVDLGQEEKAMKLLNQTLAHIHQYFY